jgi:hypothetical protein
MCSPSQGYYQSTIESTTTKYNHDMLVEALVSLGITETNIHEDIKKACAWCFSFGIDKDSERSMILRQAMLDIHFHGNLKYDT